VTAILGKFVCCSLVTSSVLELDVCLTPRSCVYDYVRMILAMLLESMLVLISTQSNLIMMVVSKWLARSMMFGLILLVVALSL